MLDNVGKLSYYAAETSVHPKGEIDLSLPGVSIETDSAGKETEEDLEFTVVEFAQGKKKEYIFKASSKKQLHKWVHNLRQAKQRLG